MLILGPTGAGKSLMARRIYELKKTRRLVKGPFVEINCATIRGDAAMSALFGHVRGAFTGAVRERPGLLLSADGGVLFLDEIGELGLDEQAMLLRALEEKRFLPLGSDREVSSDFQLIAGTNRDLTRLVAEGRFREDLLARINLWTFRLPGLAERREDIAPNLDYELEQFRRRTGTAVTFSLEARQAFLAFACGHGCDVARQLPRPQRGRRRGWRRWRQPAGSLWSRFARRSATFRRRGRIAGPNAKRRWSTPWSHLMSAMGSIASIASSSRTCWRCAGKRRACRRPGAGCSTDRGRASRASTTPIACGSTWPGSRSTGPR